MDIAKGVLTSRDALYASKPLSSSAEEIRLLHLLPESFDMPINCEFSVASLNDYEYHNVSTTGLFHHGAGPPPPYEALSYTWGSKMHTEHIHVDHCCQLSITENLSAALRDLRKTDQSRVLWVDALSINQDDNYEKSSQIQLMGKVYARAAQVLVWLGAYGLPDKHHAERLRSRGSKSSVEASLRSALRHTEPSWWTRAWTVQEYALASSSARFCFGSHEISATYLCDLLLKGRQPDSINSPQSNDQADAKLALAFVHHLDVLETVRGQFFGGLGGTIMTLLETMFTLNASDVRDKVFSLFGLLMPEEQKYCKPEYDKATSRVFADATYATMQTLRSIEVLLYASLGISQTQGLASWAIDFSNSNEHTRPRSRLGLATMFEEPVVVAPKWWYSQPTTRQDAVLLVHGQAFDSIQVGVGTQALRRRGGAREFLNHQAWENVTYFYGKLVQEEIRCWSKDPAPQIDQLAVPKICNDPFDFLKAIFQRWTNPNWTATTTDREGSIASSLEAWLMYFAQSSIDPAVFIARRGIVGIAPVEVAANDELVFLRGMPVPAVLSPLKDGRFFFRGFALIYGFSQDEIWEFLEALRLQGEQSGNSHLSASEKQYPLI